MFPEVDAPLVCEFSSFVTKHVVALLGPSRVIRPVPWADFLSRFPANTRKRLEAAHEELKYHPLTVDEATRVMIFVKIEMLLGKVGVTFDDQFAIPRAFVEWFLDPAPPAVDITPRIISAATPTYNCLVGPTIVALQSHMCNVWNHLSPIFMTARTTQANMGDWFNARVNAGDSFLEVDMERYDASMKSPYQLALIRILAIHFHLPRTVVSLMIAKLHRVCHSPHGVRAESWGGETNSGDPQTFLFNSMHNALHKAFVHYKLTGELVDVYSHRRTTEVVRTATVFDDTVEPYAAVETLWTDEAYDPVTQPYHPTGPPNRMQQMVAGDDSLTAYSPHSRFTADHVPPMVALYSRMGQLAVAVWHGTRWADCEYCSGIFWHIAPNTRIFGPKPGRILAKACIIKDSVRAGADAAASYQQGVSLLAGNLLGLRVLCQDIPILREYMRHMLKITRKYKAQPVRTMQIWTHRDRNVARDMRYDPNAPTLPHNPTVVAQMFARYGWTTQTLASFERFLSGMTDVGTCTWAGSFDPLEVVFERDGATRATD